MRLRWTVVVRGRLPAVSAAPGVVADAVRGPVAALVDCPAGTRLDQLPGLAEVLSASSTPPATVTVGGVPVPAGGAVGVHPLVDGAVLTLTSVSQPSRHRSDGATGPTGHARPPTGRRHLLELVVLAGPDAGVVHPLAGGRVRCGRAAAADLQLRDPRLSRSHCDLIVRSDGVLVRDLGSTNGTAVPGTAQDAEAGQPDGAGPADLRLLLGQRCRLGASVVAVRAVRPRPAGRGEGIDAGTTGAARTGGDGTRGARTGSTEGTVLLHRAPRARTPEQAPSFILPPLGRPPRSTAFPLLAVLLPAVAAAALVLWTGSTAYLLLAGLGPLLVAGGWLTSRRDARREGLLGRREHALRCAALRAAAGAAAQRLAEARLAALPDADAVLRRCAADGDDRVWERDPDDDDGFRVRLGLAVADETHGDGVARQPPTAFLPRVQLTLPDGTSEQVRSSWDVVSVDLAEGALGLAEPADVSSVRFLVGQLVTSLPPGRLSVLPVVSGVARDRWRWLRLLPHLLSHPPDAAPPPTATGVRDGARWLGDLVRSRSEATGGGHPDRHGFAAVLVIVDDPGGELGTDDLAWLPDAHRVGVHVVTVAQDPDHLPRGCRTVVQPFSADGVERRATWVADGSAAVFVADRVGPWWSDRLARQLAPLRLSADRGQGSLPDQVTLTDLLDLSEQATDERWRACGDDLSVPLGVGPDGPFVVDLVRSGPHALVAGTTGSGKSELLRAWLLGLAASYPPDRLALLLVDYKGGATFDELAALPHTVGMLTDLDSAATTRVLHSLRAEVRRRERLLAAVGARDLLDLRHRGSPREQLPRLLVVVDEFRVLADDAPQVLSEFVRLAATGRSLGIHLVLATQRPGGVVSADIRANAALRIALRVQDAGESRDVVDRADAATLPADRPGRAVVVGAGADGIVQGAWLGGTRGEIIALRHDPWWEDGSEAGPAAVGDVSVGRSLREAQVCSAATELVARLVRAAAATGRPAALSPWLPPLPAHLEPRDLTARAVPDAGAADPDRLVVGVTDLPWSQSRGELSWQPTADGPAMVLGGARSGRSSTLSRMEVVARRHGCPVVRVSGESDDPDHAVDVLTCLATLEPETELQDAPPGLRVLLLVDDADSLLDPAGDPVLADLLTRIMRTGHRAGIGVAVAGGRQTAVSRLASAAGFRLIHRIIDPVDAVAAGLAVGARPTSDVPGRCLVLGLPSRLTDTDDAADTAVEAQVFAPGPSAEPGDLPLPSPLPLPLPPDGLTEALPVQTDRSCRPLGLPRRLPRRLAGPLAGSGALPDQLALGVVAPDGDVWGLSLGTALFAVVGPARSGRSSVLRTLQEQATTRHLQVTRADGGRLPILTGTADCDARRPLDLLLVDDAERLEARSASALETWLSGGGGELADRMAPGATVVLAGLTDAFADDFRGLPLLVRRHGLGIVLAAGRTDARNVLGCREPAEQRTRLPGRGLLVEHGRVRRIQIAVPGYRVDGGAGPT